VPGTVLAVAQEMLDIHSAHESIAISLVGPEQSQTPSQSVWPSSLLRGLASALPLLHFVHSDAVGRSQPVRLFFQVVFLMTSLLPKHTTRQLCICMAEMPSQILGWMLAKKTRQR
jgi:hypothetical protein